jgi:site-specific recombinase XerD
MSPKMSPKISSIFVSRFKIMKASIILDESKIGKLSQTCPLFLRITSTSKKVYISTSISIPKQNWDKKRHRVIKHIDSENINQQLNDILINAEKTIKTLKKSNPNPTLEDVKSALKKNVDTEHDFFSFTNFVIENYKLENKFDTVDRCYSLISKLKLFLNEKNLHSKKIDIIPFELITEEFIKKYVKFCRDSFKNIDSTIQKDVKLISTILNKAIKKSFATSNPTKEIALKPRKPNPKYLTDNELAILAQTKLNTQSEKEALALFLFCSKYTGFRVNEVLRLKVQDIYSLDTEYPEIHITNSKGENAVAIPLAPEALSFIMPFIEGKNGNEFVFSFWENQNVDFNNLEQVKKKIKAITSRINKALAVIAKRAGITKGISTHWGRNSFGSNLVSNNCSIQLLQSLLGHSDLRMTLRYAHIQSGMRHEEMRRITQAREKRVNLDG